MFLNLKHPVYAYSKPKLLTEDELYDIYESDEADNAEALVKEKTIARAKNKMREVIGVLKMGYSFKDGVATAGYDSQATTVESLLDYSAFPKRVAFKDGKLVAFGATDNGEFV
ncbi:MAG: hypothetical protein ACI4QD_05850 [Kiritimatiellia bacterium]